MRKPVSKNTQLTIEGFPRSANTYTLFAFNYVQLVKVRIAHHWHIPAQVIKAARLKIPTLVLIRSPIDAIGSYLIYNPSLPTRQVIRSYISYYEAILPYKTGYIVASFEEATQHLDKVITTVNDRFHTNFEIPNLIQNDIKKIIRQIHQVNLRLNRGIEKLQTPNCKRNRAKKLVFEKIHKRKNLSVLKNAERVYETFLYKTKSGMYSRNDDD